MRAECGILEGVDKSSGVGRDESGDVASKVVKRSEDLIVEFDRDGICSLRRASRMQCSKLDGVPVAIDSPDFSLFIV